MSDTKTLKEKFRTAPEVTSLASTDRLAVIGRDGETKRVSVENAVFKNTKINTDFGSTGSRWITIAEFNQTDIWGGILVVSVKGWAGSPLMYIFAIGGVCVNGIASRPNIYSLFGPTTDIKFRVVLADSRILLEVYEHCRLLRAASTGYLSLINPVESAAIPSDATVWDYDFSTSVNGIVRGGKRLSFNKLRNYTERRWVA